MRATLISLAILALLCPAGICLAQDAPPDKASLEAADEAAKATTKAEASKADASKPSASASPDSASEPSKAKPGKGRVGTLSADEARRAARARKRAAAEFKGRGAVGTTKGKADIAKSREEPTRDATRAEPKRATASPRAEKPEKSADEPLANEPAKKAEAPEAKQPAKDAGTLKAKEPVSAAVAPQKDEPSNEAGASADKELVKSEPVKSAEKPALKETARTETSRAPESRPANGLRVKKATRSTDSRRARTGAPQVRYHYAGDATAPRVGDVVPPGVRLAPVPRRFWRYGRSDQRVIGAERRRRYFVERFVDRPRPPWRFMAGGPVMEAYPPYPGPFATYSPYPPPVYVEP